MTTSSAFFTRLAFVTTAAAFVFVAAIVAGLI